MLAVVKRLFLNIEEHEVYQEAFRYNVVCKKRLGLFIVQVKMFERARSSSPLLQQLEGLGA